MINSLLELELRQILDACAEMILICDPDGQILHANPPLCTTSGYTKEELLGHPIRMLDSPDAGWDTRSRMSASLKVGNSWNGRVLLRRNNTPANSASGESHQSAVNLDQYWAEVTVSPIHGFDDTLLGYVQIQRDISADIAAENSRIQEAADAQARLQIARQLAEPTALEARLNQVLDILFELDGLSLRKGCLFQRNGDGWRPIVLHGSFSEAFCGQERFVAASNGLCARAADADEVVISDDCSGDLCQERELPGVRSHGHYVIPLRHNGETLGVLALDADPYPSRDAPRLALLKQVGELIAMALLREEAQAALTDARNQALQAADAKAAFLANMSHEIRTPMNGVLGMLEILGDTSLTAEQRELVETASGSAEALLGILNDILDFSKLEARKVEIEAVPFDLVELVEETCTVLATQAHAKGIELNLDLQSGLTANRLGDPTRIRQVLTNLIGNAVKFTETGEVTATLRAREQRVIFKIRDTGIGIAPEVQARLFQPFTQADVSTTRQFGGTGLGLVISKHLVERMSGWITVDSNPGHGATFRFELPLPALDDQPDKSTVALSGKRVLIVDDNATNRRILNSHLTQLGLIVAENQGGFEALARLRKDPAFDLVILDYHMPGMDGVQLAEAMHADRRLTAIPRVLLSSGAQLSAESRRKVGILTCLLKPIRRDGLRRVLLETLQADPMPLAAPAQTVADPNWQGRQVLVAEDNPVNQKVVTSHLSKFGLAVELVANGAEALAKLAERRFDLVLMDCQMPVMDGYQATRTLRMREQSEILPRTRVIALTAYAGDGEREKCLSAGMDDYLTKPVTKQALIELLNRHFRADATNSPDRSNDQKPVCDLEAAIETLDGDRELLEDMIRLFLDDAPIRLEVLRRAQANRDAAALADAAHALKGMVAHFHAARCRELAARVEHDARCDGPDARGDPTALAAAVRELMAELQASVAYV